MLSREGQTQEVRRDACTRQLETLHEGVAYFENDVTTAAVRSVLVPKLLRRTKTRALGRKCGRDDEEC